MPKLRKKDAGLDVHEVEDGLIVYDHAAERVHYLNATAAVLFELCDGRHDAAGLAELLAKAYSLEQPPLDEVTKSLDDLVREGLVESV